MCNLTNENGITVSYDLIRQAMKGRRYPMSLVGEDAKAVMRVVNIGIDCHLEACFVPDRGDEYGPEERKVNGRTFIVALKCKVSAESLPVLLRRLFENEQDGNETAANLASGILETLGIDEYGHYNPEEKP